MASDGYEALNILVSFVPDIIFVDLVMPKIGGDLLCRLVRRMPKLKSCYLVVVSAALAEMDLRPRGFGGGRLPSPKDPTTAWRADILGAVREAEAAKNDGTQAVRGLDTLVARQITRELLSRNRHLEGMLAILPEGVLEIFSGHIVLCQ